MQLLDPENRHPSIAGWRDLLTPADLAKLLGITVEQARIRFRGRDTWSEEERARLLIHMVEREGEVSISCALDIRLLVGVPFFLIGPDEANMVSSTYMIQLLDAKETWVAVSDYLGIMSQCPPDAPVHVGKQNYRYTLEKDPATQSTGDSAVGNTNSAWCPLPAAGIVGSKRANAVVPTLRALYGIVGEPAKVEEGQTCRHSESRDTCSHHTSVPGESFRSYSFW